MTVEQQIYYWAHMLDEAMCNKTLILEDKESDNVHKAKRYLENEITMPVIWQLFKAYDAHFKDNLTRGMTDARKVIDYIREKIPSSRLPYEVDSNGQVIMRFNSKNKQQYKQSECKFLVGVCRIFINDVMPFSKTFDKNVQNLEDAVRIIGNNHVEDFTSDLNGMNLDTLYKSVKNEIETEKNTELASMVELSKNAKNLKKNEDYRIIPINSFEEAHTYAIYVPWCVTKGERFFNNYTSNGLKRFYFVFKNGFENMKRPAVVDNNNEYSKSALAILITPEGLLDDANGCTGRYNSGGRIMEPEEIQELLGVDFAATFKPWSTDEMLQIYKKMQIEDDEVSKQLDAMKCEDRDYNIFGNYILNFQVPVRKCISNRYIYWRCLCPSRKPNSFLSRRSRFRMWNS